MYDTTPDEPRTTDVDPTDDVDLDAEPVTSETFAVTTASLDEQETVKVPSRRDRTLAMFERALANAKNVGDTKRANDLEDILRKG